MSIKLTMTCGPYDRARALIDGTVKPEGIDLDVYVNKDPGRHTKIDGREFDIAEFYSGLYIADLQYKSLGYTAIPIFVKRMFRHSYIYINKRAGIRSPADLNGKRIGVQNWLTTTAVWARGLLEDEYDLDPKSVSWFTERMRGVGDWKPPDWLELEHIPEKSMPVLPPELGSPTFTRMSTSCSQTMPSWNGIISSARASSQSCILS